MGILLVRRQADARGRVSRSRLPAGVLLAGGQCPACRHPLAAGPARQRLRWASGAAG